MCVVLVRDAADRTFKVIAPPGVGDIRAQLRPAEELLPE